MRRKASSKEVTDTLRQIIALSKPLGLTLFKYREKRIEAFMYTITYALHASRDRPGRSTGCSGPFVKIPGPEGAASNKRTYSKLTDLLTTLKGGTQ